MKITLEQHGMRYTAETVNPKQDDFNSGEMKEIFSRLMVQDGFGPSVLETEDGGKYEYVDPEYEIVVKKEYLEELEERAKKNENN